MRGLELIALSVFLGCTSLKSVPQADTGRRGVEEDSGTQSTSLEPVEGEPPEQLSVDCSRIPAANHDWELCFEGESHCEAIYTNASGCSAVCAAADLVCTGAYENRDDACAPDLDRDILPCESGHQSDYCICGGSGLSSVTDPGSSRIETLLAERAGFGAETQGGDPAWLYTVTTLADTGSGSLRWALESEDPWVIEFAVDGRIHWETEVRVRSYKTVDGRGHDITVDGTWHLLNVHDVIISDLALTRSIRAGEAACEQDGDVVLIHGTGGESPADFGAHHIWLHHLDLQDGGDGLLDIRGGTYITVSWSRFAHHKKVSLLWQDQDGRPTEGMRLTWHHNYFDHTTVRNPRLHYGQAHFVNNYIEEWWQSGAASYDGAQFLSEANVYLAADDCYGIPGVLPCVDDNPCAINNDWYVDRSRAVVVSGDSDEGFVRSIDDLLLNGAQIEVNRPSAVFDPGESYSFIPDPATEELADIIAAESGPRVDWTE